MTDRASQRYDSLPPLPSAVGALHARLFYTPRKHQAIIHRAVAAKRFVVAVCHRRMGKTVAAVVELFTHALACPHPRPQVFYIAPTEKAAKRIAWSYVTQIADLIPGAQIRQSELKVTLPGGATVQLLGSDSPDRLRGLYADFVVMDEFAFQKPETWTSVVRPALADRKGGALFISTPNGHDLFWQLAQYAGKDSSTDWQLVVFRASETGVLSDSELEEIRQTVPEDEYLREFEVEFDAPPAGSIYGEVLMKGAQWWDGDLPHDAPRELWWYLDEREDCAAMLVARTADALVLLRGEAFPTFRLADAEVGWWVGDGVDRIIVPHDFVRSSYGGPTWHSRLSYIREHYQFPLTEARLAPFIDGVEHARAAIRDGVVKFMRSEDGERLVTDLAQPRFQLSADGTPQPRVVDSPYRALEAVLRMGASASTPAGSKTELPELDYRWVV